MSVDFNSWLGSSAGAIPAASRAARAWLRIQRDPSSIVFRSTTGAFLAPQTVRLESDSSASPAVSAAGTGSKIRVVVFGIRDHPTLPTTDLKAGYRFQWNSKEVRCETVILQVGEVQGIFEST